MDINDAWNSTCKVLLGGEIGELKEYEKWLLEDHGPRMIRPSCRSKKEVVLVSARYPKSAQMASFDEIDLNQKYGPLSINEMKDIDSIQSAIAERAVYSGNLVLGESDHIELSTIITDSHYVLQCERAAFSKYLAYSCRGSYSEYIFGCNGFGPARFCIKSNGVWDTARCLACTKVDFTSDAYFSHGLAGCADCLFCFNLRNARQCIGNLPLEKGKYIELKKKLLDEMRQTLAERKRLPSLIELVRGVKPDTAHLSIVVPPLAVQPARTPSSSVEKAFQQTSRLLFGTELKGLEAHAVLLEYNSNSMLTRTTSCLSGREVLVAQFADFDKYPTNRLLTFAESGAVGNLRLSDDSVSQLDLQNAGKILSPIALFCPEWQAGKVGNNTDAPTCIDSQNCFHGSMFMLSKLCGYCYLPRNCESIFGCREARHGAFSINCHFSTKISRCFELDNCNNCSDCYFCHNVENCTECLFCFNVKAKRYAIGNVEMKKEEYLKIKKLVLTEIANKLEKDKKLDLNIYNVGGRK